MNAALVCPIEVIHEVLEHGKSVIVQAFPDNVEGWTMTSRAITGTTTSSKQGAGGAAGQTKNQCLLKEGTSRHAARAHFTENLINSLKSGYLHDKRCSFCI